MSVSRTALRLIALLFLLAGVLLLRRPVFGQASTAAPTPHHLPDSEKPVRPRTVFSDCGHLRPFRNRAHPSSPDGTYSPRTTYLAM
jgi:hypothetical protein